MSPSTVFSPSGVLHTTAFTLPPSHAVAELQLCTLCLHICRQRLPKLAGAELRVPELLNQACLNLGVFALGQHVLQKAQDRKPLHALGAPVCRYLAGVAPPQLLGVALKKHAVQHLAKAVDIEVFKVRLWLFHRHGLQVAEPGLHRGGKAHVADCFPLHADGVIEEMVAVINAGHAVSHQHYAVLLLRVRPALCQRLFAAEPGVIKTGRALQGHPLRPSLHNLVAFREKAVPANIHTVALIAHGARDTAYLTAFLQNGDVIWLIACKQLFGCRQPGRPGADDDDSLHIPISSFPAAQTALSHIV